MVRDETDHPRFGLEDQATEPAPSGMTSRWPAAVVDGDGGPDVALDDDLVAARDAWETDEPSNQHHAAIDDEVATPLAINNDGDDAERLADPFVGRWNQLISSTNWEKGHIINQWRMALIDAGAAPSAYSDEVWARQVGGVTASHVGRLRRVYDAFAGSYQSYSGLYWTHFLVALDWDDAPLWLEGAAQSGWSVSAMRQQRWQANGGDEATRPTEGDVVSSDLDEDFDPAAEQRFTQPGQGGGSSKNYEDGPNSIGAGPAIEGPDFGDEESLNRAGGDFGSSAPEVKEQPADGEAIEPLVRPFAGLPELPNDLADAVELLKLAVLRHKTAGWKEVSADAVGQYLQAFNVLLQARGK